MRGFLLWLMPAPPWHAPAWALHAPIPEVLQVQGSQQDVVLGTWEARLAFRHCPHERIREDMLPLALATVKNQDPCLILKEG